MRRFLILGHKAAIDPSFTLNDLPGAAGRLDVLCRALGATLFLSHGIRRDVETHLLLQNQIRIRVSGQHVKRLNPDERSTAAIVKHALVALEEGKTRSTPGVEIERCDLSQVVDEFIRVGASPIVLHEEGVPAADFIFPSDPAFILSDHMEFSETDQRVLAELPRLSLGARALHTSQAITIAHYLLDQQDGEDAELDADLVLVHKVWGDPKALMITSLLEDFDIPVVRMAQSPPGIFPMVVDGMAEVRIMVRSRDASKAQQIIADYFEEPTDE